MTKHNCKFTVWWLAFNDELIRRGWAKSRFNDARDGYEAGWTPQEAAKKYSEMWMTQL